MAPPTRRSICFAYLVADEIYKTRYSAKALDMRCQNGNASEVTLCVWARGRSHSDHRCRRQHIECEQSEHISNFEQSEKYIELRSNISTQKEIYAPCELTAVAVALRASSSFNEGSRSNLHSLACASTDSLRLIFELRSNISTQKKKENT